MIVVNKNNILRIILTVLIAITISFIWSNSLESAQESTEISNSVIDILKPIIDPNNKIRYDTFETIIRKAAHFSEFALLGCEAYLLSHTYEKLRQKTIFSFLIPTGLSFAVAITDECLQLTSPGRSCQFSDMMIDLAGIITGIVVVSLLFNVIRIIISKVK